MIKTFTPQILEVTGSAVTKVKSLQAEEDNQDLKLRIFVTGGGCSGFQYGFSFEELTTDDDITVSQDGITVLIDSLSYQYLVGSKVDYEEDLMGSKFVISNPNATTTCGCGSSFTI
jgi:iron-sulfur cluster insertion protein